MLRILTSHLLIVFISLVFLKNIYIFNFNVCSIILFCIIIFLANWGIESFSYYFIYLFALYAYGYVESIPLGNAELVGLVTFFIMGINFNNSKKIASRNWSFQNIIDALKFSGCFYLIFIFLMFIHSMTLNKIVLFNFLTYCGLCSVLYYLLFPIIRRLYGLNNERGF